MSIHIIPLGENYPGKDFGPPEGKLGITFQETRAGAIKATFWKAFNEVLQEEAEKERARLLRLETILKAKKPMARKI